MAQEHPHLGATYRVFQRSDNSFAAEVTILGMNPTTITGFATEALAEAWVTKHKREIENYPTDNRTWRGRQKKRL
ncbi:MAG TPA: hypothetical protein VJR47_16560 [Stellaceae bacterium]|nr:hypothetical protein [Stellaceae bacterium]